MAIKCRECPRCKDTYPGKLDYSGNHFCICGMSGNMVYTEPRKVKKYNGNGYIQYPAGSCGLFETVEDALSKMTKSEIETWQKGKEQDQ